MISQLLPTELAILALYIPLATLLLVPVQMVIAVSAPRKSRS